MTRADHCFYYAADAPELQCTTSRMDHSGPPHAAVRVSAVLQTGPMVGEGVGEVEGGTVGTLVSTSVGLFVGC